VSAREPLPRQRVCFLRITALAPTLTPPTPPLPHRCTFTGHEDQILCKSEADALLVCKTSACWRAGYAANLGPAAYYSSAEGLAADASFTAYANDTHRTADRPVKAEYHHHAHHALIFMFVALVMGCATEWFLCRYAHWMPYTVAVLLEGGILAIVNAKTGSVHWLCQHGQKEVAHVMTTVEALTPTVHGGLGTLSASMAMWSKIDPHLLLFAFLPALLFGDAMGLNVHLSKKMFSQCLLLAGPGVLVGTALTAAAGYYVFPYGWTAMFSLTFGSIMAATDPVAVVALLKALGASPKLTMIITGESLMNDGTAIVLFTLFQKALETGSLIGAGDIVKFFCRLALGGPALGGVFGLATVYIMSKSARKTEEADTIVQIAITICCAYLSFFVCEDTAHVSGVLGCVSAALVCAAYVWPLVCSHETMHHVWHMVEYIGNTLIFMLAGVIIGETIVVRSYIIQGADFGWLFVMYLCIQVIRAVMMLCFAPMLMNMGYGVTWKELFFMSWGGLRGAVGLALAIVIDNDLLNVSPSQYNHCNASQMMFHVGSLAALTLLVNGILSGPILNYLEMTKTPEAKVALLESVRNRVAASAAQTYKELEANPSFSNHDHEEVHKFCGILRYHKDVHAAGADEPERTECYAQMLINVREVFMSVVRADYWEQIERHELPHDSDAALNLITSTDIAMDHVHEKLNDWAFLKDACVPPPRLVKFLKWLDKMLPESSDWDDALLRHTIFARQESSVFITMAFVNAHKAAQKKVAAFFGEDATADSPEEIQVIAESEALVLQAHEMLDSIPADLLKAVVSKQVAGIVLGSQADSIEHLEKEGMLTPNEASAMMEDVTHDMHAMSAARKKQAGHFSKLATVKMKSVKLQKKVSLEANTQQLAVGWKGNSIVPIANVGGMPVPVAARVRRQTPHPSRSRMPDAIAGSGGLLRTELRVARAEREDEREGV
jgi:NhaP-type Na+/H+ or K+/H+ antiporter